MNQKTKLFFLTFGLGLFSVAAHASCDECDQPEPPLEAECDPDGPGGPSGSMSEDIVIDDVSAITDKPVAQAADAKANVKPSAEAGSAGE